MMKRKGFTLIELLIVVTIIGILAVALVPRIIGGSADARDARRQTDVQSIVTGLEYYLSETGSFTSLGAAGSVLCSSAITGLSSAIGAMPSDPKSGISNTAFGALSCADYVVYFMKDSSGNNTKYAVAALLEGPAYGDDFVYLLPSKAASDVYSSLSLTAYPTASTAAGYYVVY